MVSIPMMSFGGSYQYESLLSSRDPRGHVASSNQYRDEYSPYAGADNPRSINVERDLADQRIPEYSEEIEELDGDALSQTHSRPESQIRIWQNHTKTTSMFSTNPVGRLSPRSLQKPSGQRIWEELPQLITFALGLAFLALAISAVSLRGQEESSRGRTIVQMTILAPTLWPIVFAATVGGSMRAWAQHLAERGTTLGVLEQLQGSQSLSGLLKSFWSLRIVSLLNLLLLCIWAFSFLGSQASLRSIYLIGGSVASNRTYSYMNYSLISEAESTALSGADFWQFLGAMASSIFISSLMSRDATVQYVNGTPGFPDLIKSLGTNTSASLLLTDDAWGNPLIPRLESLDGFRPSNPRAWVNVPYDQQIVNYASLIGMPVRGQSPSDSGTSNFMINATYSNFDCSAWTRFNITANWTVSGLESWMSSNYPSFSYYYNQTLDVSPWTDAFYALFRQNPTWPTGFFMDKFNDSTTRSANTAQTSNPAKAIFGTTDLTMFSATTCEVTTNYVNLNISCGALVTGASRRFCAATQARMSPDTTQNINESMFTGSVSWANGVAELPAVFKPGHEATTPPIARYLQDPAKGLWASDGSDLWDIGLIPIDLFARRLALVWNTFTRSAYQPGYIIGGDFAPVISAVNTTALYSEDSPPQYALNGVWITIFFISIAVMLVSSAATFVLSARTQSPDVLGYVSSQMRDNPYFQEAASKEGTMLDGAETARKWKHLRVQLADVQGNLQVGKIAFVECGQSPGSTARNTRLKPKRLYA